MTYSRLAFAAAGLLLLAACHDQTTQATQEPTAPTPTGPQCYAHISATDTVRLTLQITPPTIAGQLTYNYF